MLDDVYRSEARFLEHLQTQAANIGQYKNEVLASGDDINGIMHDAAVFESLIETCNLADDFKTTAMGIKRQFFSTKTSPPAGAFMTAPDTSPPFPVEAGAVKRSRERDQRFLRAIAITEAARIALDLVGETPQALNPDSVQPTAELHAAVSGYEFAAVINNRQNSDMYEIHVQRSGSTVWTMVKSGTGKSVNVTITPTTPGQPEQLLVRVQLYKGNTKYGVPSNPIFVTVNP